MKLEQGGSFTKGLPFLVFKICHFCLGGRFPGPMAGDGAAAAVSELWLPPAASGTGMEGQEKGERQGN